MFLITKHAMLDTGFCLPAISCASGAGRRGYQMKKEKRSIIKFIQYRASSIQYHLALSNVIFTPTRRRVARPGPVRAVEKELRQRDRRL